MYGYWEEVGLWFGSCLYLILEMMFLCWVKFLKFDVKLVFCKIDLVGYFVLIGIFGIGIFCCLGCLSNVICFFFFLWFNWFCIGFCVLLIKMLLCLNLNKICLFLWCKIGCLFESFKGFCGVVNLFFVELVLMGFFDNGFLSFFF